MVTLASGRAEGWSSRFGFLMASIGFAVGLGNIWRFPYIAGENGGGAFVAVYVLCAFGIGVPILMAEILIGRRGGGSPLGAMRAVAEQEGRSKHWRLVGGLNLLAAFVILVVYCVVAGWVLFYLYKAVITGFSGIDAAMAATQFDDVLASTPTMLFWTIVGLTLTGVIVYAGIRDGIERAVTILMPSLFALLLLLVVYNVFAGGFTQAVIWLFAPDFSKVDGGVFLAALGQAFFSIGVAMAGMMAYGAYLPKEVSIGQSVITIVTTDTLVAVLAGMVIFPAVFANGLDPASGTGLTFETLPVAFAQMPGGHLVSAAFFLLLSLAAITSMVGLSQPLTAWMEEHRGLNRQRSTVAVLSVTGMLSTFSILSYNVLSQWRLGGRDLNAVLDYVSNQILLPLGGLLIAVFAGWALSKRAARDELALANGTLFEVWHFLIRFLVPVAVAVIFFVGLW